MLIFSLSLLGALWNILIFLFFQDKQWELKFPQSHKASCIMKQDIHTTKSIRIKDIAHEHLIYNIKAK